MLGKQTHRMQCGMMYNDLDPELMRARQKTMALMTAYAQSYSQSPAKREALLAKILGKIGKNVHFEPTFRCEFGKNISIGDNFFANFPALLLSSSSIVPIPAAFFPIEVWSHMIFLLTWPHMAILAESHERSQ